MEKVAFTPFTQAAEQAPQQAPAPQGQPMPPQGAPAPQGQPMPPQGAPQGQPMTDPETGFIILDEAQGIQQDPLTGILINMSTQEFADPQGNLLDPQQAMMMIQQAREGGGAPAGAEQGQPMPQQGPMPGAGPEQAAPPQGGHAGQTFDPSIGMYIDDATGMPVDPATGMLIDPSTGELIDPNTGATAPGAEEMAMFDDPEMKQAAQETLLAIDNQNKEINRVDKSVTSLRSEVQRLQRTIEGSQDKQDLAVQKMEDVLRIIEGAAVGG